MKWISFLIMAVCLLGCGSDNKKKNSSSNPVELTVSYDGNGHTGGSAPIGGSIYNQGETVTVLSNMGNLVKTGFTFLGWNTTANGDGTQYSPSSTFVMPNTDVVLYARWVSGNLVIYNTNGATSGSAPIDTESYSSGDTATVLGNTGSLSRGGYSFSGWNTQANGSGTGYNPTASLTMSSSSITLYAQWTALSTNAVTYDGNGHDSGAVPVDGNSYWSGAVVSVATNTGSLVKAGHTFAGWSVVLDGSQHAVGETFFMPAGPVTLRAQWVVDGSYSLTYNGNGHTDGAVPVNGSSPFVSGTSVTVTGNVGGLARGTDTFLGWNTSANGTGTNYSAGNTFNISTHTVLYARWTQNYSVSFSANGGTGTMTAKSIAAGTSAKLPANTLTRNGYLFTGWATTPTGAVVYNDQQNYLMGNSNVTLYAKWVESNSLKVSYNFNSQTLNDTSGGGMHATGSGINFVPDGSGFAIQMSGTNSYIALPTDTIRANENFTIMMRFKASPSQHGSLFGYQNAAVGSSMANEHVPMIVVRSDGRLRGELWLGAGGELEVISQNAVNDGQWHTVYFSSTGGTIKLFLDGVLLAQATGAVDHLAMTYNQIGASRTTGRTLMPNVNEYSNNWYYFNGLVDDFFFYDTAL